MGEVVAFRERTERKPKKPRERNKRAERAALAELLTAVEKTRTALPEASGWHTVIARWEHCLDSALPFREGA